MYNSEVSSIFSIGFNAILINEILEVWFFARIGFTYRILRKINKFISERKCFSQGVKQY